MKTIIISLFICVNGFAQINVVNFFDLLYSENSIKIEQSYEEVYNLFCDQHGIDKNNTHNKGTFYKLYFLHKLFTTTESMDCSASGILEIPYFWDYSRDYISAPDNVVLTDRTPEVFLSDLVSNKPQYSYECEVGEKEIDFYTFGWCAEREMAFVSLLRHMGVESYILADGGHAWSEVHIPMYVNDRKEEIVITIDNTYDEFYVQEYNFCCFHDCQEYDYNCAHCLMVQFYNPSANRSIEHILVSKSAAERINKLVSNKLN
jgi:hypothetical protein